MTIAFERVYNMEVNEQEPVALTSNTTEVCDVSPTTYIEQTPPTIYAHVYEHEFIPYIGNQYRWWSFHYIQSQTTNAKARGKQIHHLH